jgi:hypothetical protein
MTRDTILIDLLVMVTGGAIMLALAEGVVRVMEWVEGR